MPSSDTLSQHFLSELPISKHQAAALKSQAVKRHKGRDLKVAAEALEREAELHRDAPRVHFFRRLGVYWGFLDADGLASLKACERVESIHEATQLSLIVPKEIQAATASEDPLWNLADFKPLWDQGLEGANVLVGHLDTGVDGGHPAFHGKTIRFLEVDADGDVVDGSTNKPRDSGRHGTHTAATICGDSVEGTRVGVAPKAELVSAMVIEGGKTELRTLVGLEWALEQGVQVVNMSMGWTGYNPFFESVLAKLRDHDVIPVVAVGNEGINTSRSPGNYETVISVGAVDRAGSVPGFSSSEVVQSKKDPIKPNLVAPGVGIISARAGGGLLSMDGSSMATPHVTGLIACLLGVTGATPALVQKSILGTAGPLAHVSMLRQGEGRISPTAALRTLEELVKHNQPRPQKRRKS
jgi:subtilisin family serine protease